MKTAISIIKLLCKSSGFSKYCFVINHNCFPDRIGHLTCSLIFIIISLTYHYQVIIISLAYRYHIIILSLSWYHRCCLCCAAKLMNIVQYKFSDIAAVTSQFSDSHVIGRGGFGVVYHAVLKNTQLAIKKLHTVSTFITQFHSRLFLYQYWKNFYDSIE